MKLSHILSAAAAASLRQVTAATAADGGCFDWNSPDEPLFHPNDWKYCQRLNDDLHIYYTPTDAGNVMLGLHARDAYGWTAVGPAGNGGMKGASQIVVRRGDDDEWIAEDRHSADYGTPSLDDSQDVQLLFAHQDDETGETAWGVVIPQDSCDEPHDYPLEDRETFLIWALGSDHDFSFHGARRGQATVNLMGPPPTEPDMEAYHHVDLVMPDVPMVRGEEGMDPTNAFVCSYFDMEVLGQDAGFTSDDKVHMVGYQPVITEGNEEFMHHMVLFSCEGYLDDSQQQLDDSHLYHQKVIPGCTNMPPGCQSFLGGWAVGNKVGGAYPPHVGVPIGEGKRWLVLQMHYYNPDHKRMGSLNDSSGLRAYVTKDLRPMDAGVMSFAVGVRTGQHPPLPGGQKDVAMETLYVEPDCTKAWTEPLTVISVSHHSHFLGTHQRIAVERDGVNLGAMRDEYAYDYNHQGGVAPNNAVKTLMPGDRLSASCHFDTTSVPANSTVQIGEESNKEMCFPTFLYYPKQELTGFAYVPPTSISQRFITDYEWCSEPSSDEAFVSKCAEQLYNDVPGFNQMLSSSLEPGLNYPSFCNAGSLTEKLRGSMPFFCPINGCAESQSCSEEELRAWAENVCGGTCGRLGLTLYPDVSSVKLPDSSNIACPNTLFNAPTLAEQAACQAKGSLPQAIELTNALGEVPGDQGNSGANLVWNSYVAILIFCTLLV